MRVMGFPGRYIQGPGALASLGSLVSELGCHTPVVISDDLVEQALGRDVPQALADASLAYRRLQFAGECTRAAINALAAEAQAAGTDIVIALGGGKTIDTAKGVAKVLDCRLAIAPTVASNDSPTSRLIVIYDESHRLVEVDYLVRNPDVVLVDTAVIVRAPVRFFRAGIGDAVSKRFEARQCALAGGRNFFGGTPPDTAGVLADQCHRVIVEKGEAALLAVCRRETDDAVESVTEATVLLSGLAFESGGLSLSHALLRGLTAIPSLAGALHGEMVAYGTVIQLLLEEAPSSVLNEHLVLLTKLGLPLTLRELGGPDSGLSPGELRQVAEATSKAPYFPNFRRPLRVDDVVRAMVAAEQWAN